MYYSCPTKSSIIPLYTSKQNTYHLCPINHATVYLKTKHTYIIHAPLRAQSFHCIPQNKTHIIYAPLTTPLYASKQHTHCSCSTKRSAISLYTSGTTCTLPVPHYLLTDYIVYNNTTRTLLTHSVILGHASKLHMHYSSTAICVYFEVYHKTTCITRSPLCADSFRGTLANSIHFKFNVHQHQ